MAVRMRHLSAKGAARHSATSIVLQIVVLCQQNKRAFLILIELRSVLPVFDSSVLAEV